MIREGVRSLLAHAPDIEVVGEARDGPEAVDHAQRSAAQVILIDLALPGLDGVEAIRRILAAQPEVGIVALADAEGETQIVAALEAGASGFLAKTCPPADFTNAIRRVAGGEAWLPWALTRRLLVHVGSGSDEATAETLTAREREVLGLLACGASNREIARELCIAEITVRTHVGRILGKLEVDNRVEAALYAVRRGLAPLGGAAKIREDRTRSERAE